MSDAVGKELFGASWHSACSIRSTAGATDSLQLRNVDLLLLGTNPRRPGARRDGQGPATPAGSALEIEGPRCLRRGENLRPQGQPADGSAAPVFHFRSFA